MTINLISDIHCRNTNFTHNFDFEKLAPADVLVVAGDIGTFLNRDKIIKKINDNYIGQDKKFKSLVYCYGNHDYYVTDHFWMMKHGNMYRGPLVTDNHVNIFDDTVFICSCMWSPIFDQERIGSVMNDYYYIDGFTPTKCNELFEHNAQWILDINDLYKKQGMKTVVVTHHLPTYQVVDEFYKSGRYSYLNEAFAVMDNKWEQRFFDANIDLWLHGHSHQFMDRVIGNTRYVRNPFGYDWPTIHEYLKTNFKYDYIIRI